ncbi:hypothetical protein J2Z22_004455 [Paenibacillus forsythiae]|uniref:Uncharacterized protein n=1 Tax=Paenibacillus forsythiae TaxID=365616 RepID=A0ABU3HDG3_9BACL|nr:hypothetical protein [Paenibacillus forsythiae]MDT3428861.1 hypothetical protein [Paenibacillus forsythiae]
MFRKKWRKVIVWTLAGLILLGSGGLLAVNYAINKFIASMAIDVDSGQPSNSNDIQKESNMEASEDNLPTSATNKTPEMINSEGTAAVGEQTKGSSPAAISSNGAKTNNQDTSAKDLDSVKAYSPNVSTKKIDNVKESVTIKDKANVTEILLKNLDLSSIRKLQELAKGGLTVEEKKEARAIIMSKVSPDEYNELAIIGKKYGVSEGRNYDQIMKSLEDD